MSSENEDSQFISERFRQETLRQDRYRAFDRFVDLALDGVITVPEAILAFREQYGIQLKTAPKAELLLERR